MPSISASFELARRALNTHLTVLSTIGHNVANVNTPGYSRQEAILETTAPEKLPEGYIGTGVEVDRMRRVRDEWIAHQIRFESQGRGRWQARADALEQIESLFNEPSDTSLGKVMQQFFEGLSDLANNPEKQTARIVVIERGAALAHLINGQYSHLEQLEESIDARLDAKVKEVNALSSQIAQLNEGIKKGELNGNAASDLRDKRDLLIDQLSHLLNGNIIEMDDGTLTVKVGSQDLVRGGQVFALEPEPEQLHSLITSGELKGLLEVKGELIAGYKGQLDALADNLQKKVNDLHTAGFDLEGTAGIPFFKPLEAPDSAARLLSLNEDIKAHPEKIAASQSGAVGDGRNALNLALLRNDPEITGAYRSMISHLGLESQEAQRMSENQDALLQQLENQRESVSGVSLDEEMINLIKSQKAYQFAAMYTRVIDELLDTLINRF